MTSVLLQVLGLVFVSNVVLGGFGVSENLRALNNKTVNFMYVLVFVFSVILSVFAFLIALVTSYISIQYALIGVVAVGVFVGTVAFLKSRRNGLNSALSKTVAISMFNSAVLVIPVAISENGLSFGDSLITAVGVSLGFVLISILLRFSMNNLNTKTQPKSFRGLPTALIFLGIIAMTITAIGR